MLSVVRKSELKTLREGALPAAGAWDDASAAIELPTFDHSEVTFFVQYADGTGGTGYTGEVRFEGSPTSSGDDWFPLEEVVDTTTGVVSSGQSRAFPIRVAAMRYIGAQRAPAHTVRLGAVLRVRVLAREVGDTAHPGSLTVRASATTGGV